MIEREKTHGAFSQNAHIAQTIKAVIREEGQSIESAVIREALDMIATKIGRICAGQANHEDHWKDIAGYAELAAEACRDR